jgi:hypothetical protein
VVNINIWYSKKNRRLFMKNIKSSFSGILVGILLICGIGLLWLNGGSNVSSVNSVKYNTWLNFDVK